MFETAKHRAPSRGKMPIMTRFLSRSLVAGLLGLPLALAALPAHAQVIAPTPGPDAPLPPSAQPLPLVQPAAPPSQYGFPEPGQPAQPYAQRQAYGPPPRVWTEPDREHTAPANWYGWQTLVATAPFDIAMFAALAHFSDTSGQQAFAVAFTARNLVPAVVHFAHGKVGRGFGSIGLMAASAATGVAVGYAFGLALQPPCQPIMPCTNADRGIPSAAGYGGIIGSMAGTVLDVVFFGHRQRLTWTAAKNEPSWTAAPFATQHSAGVAAGFTL